MRHVLEMTWSGYTSSQSHCVHREIVNPKRFAGLTRIVFTDGTCNVVSIRECRPREKIVPIRGYGSLLDQIARLKLTGVVRIADLPE